MSKLHETIQELKEKISVPIKEIKITSARVLEPEDLNAIKQMLGPDCNITHHMDSSILDGMTISIGNWTIDASSETSLESLHQQLLNTENVTEIEQTILGFKTRNHIQETGHIQSIKDGVVFISGLDTCEYFEIIEGENKEQLIALSLEKNHVGCICLGEYTQLAAGQTVTRTKKQLSIGISEEILSKVVDALGNDVYGNTYNQSHQILLEKIAPGVLQRQSVDVPLQTGIRAIDALIPIGRGQRELILGDRQTGKTTIALDTILNQKETGIICIYVAIGQKASKVARSIEILKKGGALPYTVVVSANAAESPGMQFLAPFTGVSIAEYFAAQGKDVLVVYDDLTKHAIAYREVSLLLKRPPGREAYPADVFYLHSRLLERACRLNKENGGGSITALPIIETLAGDISAYIPTNVISITDGQLFLESDLFYKGQRPAINIGLSVSRVGGAAQTKAIKKVAGSTKLSLAQFREVEASAQFSADLDAETKELIDQGKRTLELLKQPNNQPLSLARQITGLFGLKQGLFNTWELETLAQREEHVFELLELKYPSLCTLLNKGEWSEEIEKQLNSALVEILETF